MERSTINDATIPILADGIKWLAYLPKRKLLWNLGYYNDVLSQGQSSSTYSIFALEFNYRYGRLDRFDLKGNTQFLQSRFQFYF